MLTRAAWAVTCIYSQQNSSYPSLIAAEACIATPDRKNDFRCQCRLSDTRRGTVSWVRRCTMTSFSSMAWLRAAAPDESHHENRKPVFASKLDEGNEPRAQMWPMAISSLPPKLPLIELTAMSTHTSVDDVFFTAPGNTYMRFANILLSARAHLAACSEACIPELPANRTSRCQTPFCRERSQHRRFCQQECHFLNMIVFFSGLAGVVPNDCVKLSATQADRVIPIIPTSMNEREGVRKRLEQQDHYMPLSRLSQAPSLSFGSQSTCGASHIQSINEMLKLCFWMHTCACWERSVCLMKSV